MLLLKNGYSAGFLSEIVEMMDDITALAKNIRKMP